MRPISQTVEAPSATRFVTTDSIPHETNAIGFGSMIGQAARGLEESLDLPTGGRP